MSLDLDPMVRLALALQSSRGAYAMLLGSGISAAAGVPTGRQIVADLIGKLAALEGAAIGEDPFGWYRTRYGEEPDYSRLLDALARSPTERSALLRQYFEPTSAERASGRLVPSAAHHALAQLAARGDVSVFLTTNFDRLLEQALEGAGVSPTTLSTPDALEGTVPLGRARCTVIKLNGDYLDTRIKNTAEELEHYHPAMDRLLDRVLDEYGLIVCGWSADWDIALRRAFERTTSHRYATFWATRNPPAGEAARIVELRKADVVRIKDANAFFTELAEKVAALDRDTGTAAPAATPPLNLPSRAAAFIGRATELRDVGERLRDPSTRLLTLLGPGGTGKTTLAIEAVKNLAPGVHDGVAFVDLSGARTTAEVAVAMARAIGLDENPGRPLSEVLGEHLRPRRMLLVLDNFEQVTDSAGLVAELLARCPNLALLVTSREALRLRGEQLYPVPPLTLPADGAAEVSANEIADYESVQLFLDRARAVRPDFALTDENAAIVGEICRGLDGLPLAIELAAARLKLLSVEALHEHLRDRLTLLRSGPRDLPERQQTLRATMNWSYDLLTPDEQRLFTLLAVFAGASLTAVESVAGATGTDVDVLEGLTSLIEKSLVRRVDRPHGEPRVVMLQTICAFAVDRLDQDAGFAATARRAHAVHYAEMVRKLHADLAGSRRLAALEAMVADVENLRAAWDYWVEAGDLAELEKLADGLLILNEARGWYLATVDLTTGMLAVLGKAASSPDRINQEIALRTSLARALMASKGYTPEVEDAFNKSIEAFEQGPDSEAQFSTLRGLAKLYALRGDMRGPQLGDALVALAEREHNSAMLIEALLVVGTARMFTGELQRGYDDLERAIALFPSVPLHAFTSLASGTDPRVACYTTAAISLWQLGYPDRAIARADAALSLAAEIEHPFTIAYARFHAGLLHLWRRDFGTVIERMESLLEIAREHSFQIWRAAGTVLLGAAQAGLGRPEGLGNARTGVELYQGLRTPPVFWPILQAINASACLYAGRPADGLAPIDAAMDIVRPFGGSILFSQYELLKGDLLAARAAAEGRIDPEAENLYRQALARATELGIRISALRAQTRLCRLASATPADRLALAELVAGFDEGLDTADLIDAREALAVSRPE